MTPSEYRLSVILELIQIRKDRLKNLEMVIPELDLLHSCRVALKASGYDGMVDWIDRLQHIKEEELRLRWGQWEIQRELGRMQTGEDTVHIATVLNIGEELDSRDT